jgi:hypothetical protein
MFTQRREDGKGKILKWLVISVDLYHLCHLGAIQKRTPMKLKMTR